MNETALKRRIASNFQALVADVSAAETIQSPDNPFSHVVLSREFLEAQLSAPVLSDEKLKTVIEDIDKAIEQERSIADVMALVKTGLSLLAKHGVL